MDFLNFKLTWKENIEDKIKEPLNSVEENEYKKILLDCHKENKSFNDKVIFTFSAAAIPFLLNFSAIGKLNLYNSYVFWTFIVTIFLFVVIVILQVINNLIALKGCDHALENNHNRANWFFDKTDKIEIFLNILFFIAIFSTITTFFIDIHFKKGELMNKNPHTEQLQNSLTPAKAIRVHTTQNVKKEVKVEPKKGTK